MNHHPIIPPPSVQEAHRMARIMRVRGQASKGGEILRQAMTDALRAEREARRG